MRNGKRHPHKKERTMRERMARVAIFGLILTLAGVLAAILAAPLAAAQNPDALKEPPKAMVTIYRVTAGKHLDFLKWQAAREAVDKEAGLPVTQWYAHTDGADWDYISVGPDTTKEQDAKVDEIAKKKGLKTGFAANLEFRTFIASHSDTHTMGPLTPSQLVALAEKP